MGDSMSTHKTNSKNSKNSKKKRSAALLAAGVIGLATAGGAYAYWTSLGGGTGTASTSAGTPSALVVTGNVTNAMFPGDTAQTVTATVKNTGTENYTVRTVKAYVTTDKTDCDGIDYKLNGAPAPSTEATAASIAVTSGRPCADRDDDGHLHHAVQQQDHEPGRLQGRRGDDQLRRQLRPGRGGSRLDPGAHPVRLDRGP